VERVWYTDQGALRIRTSLKGHWESQDLQAWQALTGIVVIPPTYQDYAPVLPEENAQVRRAPSDSRRMYAFGRFVYRSEDDGRHWENVTEFKKISIVGDGLKDLAINPRKADEITVASEAGVFRSIDGGKMWHGMNEDLLNLPGARILSAPLDGHGPQIAVSGRAFEWYPGELRAWEPALIPSYADEMAQRSAEGSQTTAFAQSPVNGYRYFGDASGMIQVRFNGGQIMTGPETPGRVNAFWVDAQDPRFALAVFESGAVMHTINGGNYWAPIKGDLPTSPVNAVAVDRASNTIYVATDGGVFQAAYRLDTMSGPAQWGKIEGLPAGAVTGVALDIEKTQLWVALEGTGLYRTLAPHRLKDPLVVNAADRRARAIAPGSQVTVIGMPVVSANVDGVDAPVLNTTEVEAQIQIPYSVTGSSVSLAVNGLEGSREFTGLTLRPAAPAIFEIDGTPLLEDADRGVPLDTMNPGRSHTRVKIIAQGLGQVRPGDPQEVIEPVIAFLDRRPVEVVRSVLAPGYTGVYWIEVELPVIMQNGMAELYLQVGGQDSNKVRFYVESDLY
jgi:uncharacterized protein (TIGR03437 family)